jgi:eukaryotic-like serine/threonine-protein kinase
MDSRSRALEKTERFADRRQRYRLQKRLAQGSRGDLYLANDTFLDRVVALKILKVKVATGNMRQQLEQEAKLCAAPQNEHIAQLSDYGVTLDDQPFYITDYLTGQNLKDLLQQEKYLPVEQVVSIITQVCTGLQSIHRGVLLQPQGRQTVESVKMIHCHLMPTNIFLLQTATGVQVKVLGFDITRVLDMQLQMDDPSSPCCPSTYRYLAPEQFSRQQALDSWTDIYSLGMLLYEMLSGVDPFFGLDGQASNIAATLWMKAHLSVEPVPLRSRSRCQPLSSRLEFIVMRCLQKSPSDRFRSVDELSHALQEVVDCSRTPIVQPNQTPFISAQPAKTIKAKAPPLGLAIPPQVKEHVNATLQATDVTSSQRTAATSPQKQTPPLQTPHTSLSIGAVQLCPAETQLLSTLLSQFIGPIAPLILRQALATQMTAPQLIEYLIKTMPLNLQSQAKEQLQAFFNLQLQTLAPTSNPLVVQTPNWSEAVSKATLTLTTELNHQLNLLLTAEIGPIAPYMILKLLKQAISWQTFRESLVASVPEARRLDIDQRVANLLAGECNDATIN